MRLKLVLAVVFGLLAFALAHPAHHIGTESDNNDKAVKKGYRNHKRQEQVARPVFTPSTRRATSTSTSSRRATSTSTSSRRATSMSTSSRRATSTSTSSRRATSTSTSSRRATSTSTSSRRATSTSTSSRRATSTSTSSRHATSTSTSSRRVTSTSTSSRRVTSTSTSSSRQVSSSSTVRDLTSSSSSVSTGPTSTSVQSTDPTSSSTASTSASVDPISGSASASASTSVSASASVDPSVSASVSASSSVDSSASASASISASASESILPSSTVSSVPSASASVGPISGATVDVKLLILARDEYAAESGYHGLRGYGIPYDTVIVPQSGIDLPSFNSTVSHGRYSGIIVMDALAYEYSGIWASALTAAQWDSIHNYQKQFNVRMVRINEYPGPDFGVSAAGGGGGCCGDGVEQFMSLSDTSEFPSANLKTGAMVSSQGLWHYPAVVTDSATTKVVAKFAPGGGVSEEAAAAVINKIDGREQFVWFTSWSPQWSLSCAYLQHAYIHWVTRGLFLGKRKTHLNAQIDDLELATDMYSPAGATFRIRPADLDGHVAWMADLNSRLPAGSNFRLELGHNGNGDISEVVEVVPQGSNRLCSPDTPVYTDEVGPDPPLEFQKPLGTGTDAWPSDWVQYNWTLTCALGDDLTQWYQNSANRDAYAHVSHTFTHYELNNATYHDAAREIQFNQDWLEQVGIANSAHFSPHGLIPPAITGLHNGDVIQAWLDNGIVNVVGDNTRPLLRNPQSPYWPLISNVGDNGYGGLVIIPRWATNIYYNCDTFECDVAEWIAISNGAGDYTNLLDDARATNTAYMLALQGDPYMFHQANMRLIDMPTITVGTKTAKMSMVMAWVETVAQEVARLTNWPITSIKHDDIAQYFLDRMALDQCNAAVTYALNDAATAITSLTVSANSGCSVPIPVTIPSGGASASGGSITNDKVGSEPPIQWVKLNGGPVTVTLNTPITI